VSSKKEKETKKRRTKAAAAPDAVEIDVRGKKTPLRRLATPEKADQRQKGTGGA